jgi:hypothetical protein
MAKKIAKKKMAVKKTKIVKEKLTAAEIKANKLASAKRWRESKEGKSYLKSYRAKYVRKVKHVKGAKVSKRGRKAKYTAQQKLERKRASARKWYMTHKTKIQASRKTVRKPKTSFFARLRRMT